MRRLAPALLLLLVLLANGLNRADATAAPSYHFNYGASTVTITDAHGPLRVLVYEVTNPQCHNGDPFDQFCVPQTLRSEVVVPAGDSTTKVVLACGTVDQVDITENVAQPITISSTSSASVDFDWWPGYMIGVPKCPTVTPTPPSTKTPTPSASSTPTKTSGAPSTPGATPTPTPPTSPRTTTAPHPSNEPSSSTMPGTSSGTSRAGGTTPSDTPTSLTVVSDTPITPLASTGSPTALLLSIAGALLVVGLGCIWVARRRSALM